MLTTLNFTTVTATTFTGDLVGNVTGNVTGNIVGNADTSTASSTATIVNATTAATMYPVWVTANTGNLPLKTTSGALSFVPSTGILTSTGFAGDLVGNVTGNASGSSGTCTGNAGSASVAATSTIVDDTATAATMYPLWATAIVGNLALKGSSTKLSFRPDTGILTATGLTGALNGILGGTTPAAATVTTLSASSTGLVTGILTVGNAVAATNVSLVLNSVASQAARIQFDESGTPLWQMGKGASSENDAFELYNQAGTVVLSVAKATNVITSAGDIKNTGGQFYMTASSGAVDAATITTTGSLIVNTAGFSLKVKTGANAKMGTGILVAGSLVVSTTAALTASLIFLTVSTPGGTQGNLSYSIINATSFTVTSDNGADTSTFNWLIVDPA